MQQRGGAPANVTVINQLDDEVKTDFFAYQFSGEYLTINSEPSIDEPFDGSNRNTATLTRQEPRHARLDGDFISKAEDLAEWQDETTPRHAPRFTAQAKRQMKDVETVALLLLLIEEGPRRYS